MNLYFSKWHFSKMSGRDFIGVRVLFFFKKNVGFSNMEEQLTKSSWRKPRQKGIMDVKTGVKHFTNPVNHEKQCFLYFAKTIFN